VLGAQAGRFLLIQFGHNDGAKPGDPKQDPRNSRLAARHGRGDGPRSTIRKPAEGNGPHVRLVHAQIRRRRQGEGRTSIICSLVPRNDWKDGKVLRADNSYGKVGRESAEAERVLIDLNDIAAARLRRAGRGEGEDVFSRRAHARQRRGADVNAQCVVAGSRR
jgi:hypothetical protein